MSRFNRGSRRRPVPHEITLLAFQTKSDGTVSIVDIVETSNRNASFFARRWIRDPEISEIAAVAPGGNAFGAKRHPIAGQEPQT